MIARIVIGAVAITRVRIVINGDDDSDPKQDIASPTASLAFITVVVVVVDVTSQIASQASPNPNPKPYTLNPKP